MVGSLLKTSFCLAHGRDSDGSLLKTSFCVAHWRDSELERRDSDGGDSDHAHEHECECELVCEELCSHYLLESAVSCTVSCTASFCSLLKTFLVTLTDVTVNLNSITITGVTVNCTGSEHGIMAVSRVAMFSVRFKTAPLLGPLALLTNTMIALCIMGCAAVERLLRVNGT